jgi:hypothetical protein
MDCKPRAGKTAASPEAAPQAKSPLSEPASPQAQTSKPAGKAAAKRKTVTPNAAPPPENEPASSEKPIAAKAPRGKRGRKNAVSATPRVEASPSAVDGEDSVAAQSMSPAEPDKHTGTTAQKEGEREGEAPSQEEVPKRGRRGSAAKAAAPAAPARRTSRRAASVDDTQEGDVEVCPGIRLASFPRNLSTRPLDLMQEHITNHALRLYR